VKTAEHIRKAQPEVRDNQGDIVMPIVAQARELAEQDFGSYEGVSFFARRPGSKASGKDAHRALHKEDPGFVDVESKDSMIRRVDIFLNDHLVPIVQTPSPTPLAIAVVSHGITLSVLWRRLLQRLPPRSVTVHPEVLARYNSIDLERLGGWSNTGYLRLDVTYQILVPVSTKKRFVGPVPTESAVVSAVELPDTSASGPFASQPAIDSVSEDIGDGSIVAPVAVPSVLLQILEGWSVTVCAVNSRQHLLGLKRTGGGVGSARHDDKQKSIDTFFKRCRVE
jgi:broad specificity phosphatase PhoE